MMADGSRIVARSEDWNAMLAKNLEIYSTYLDTGEVRASIPLGSG